MASALSPVQLQFSTESVDAFGASVDSLLDLCALEALPPALKRRFEHLLKFFDRVLILRFTFVAGELRGRARPTETYLRKVAASAARQFDQGAIVVTFQHGWPILSFVARNTNVAEAGEGGNPASAIPGGGSANGDGA